jgi:hypothetical protein
MSALRAWALDYTRELARRSAASEPADDADGGFTPAPGAQSVDPAAGEDPDSSGGGGTCQPDVPDEPTPQLPTDWAPENVARVYVQKEICPAESEYARCTGEQTEMDASELGIQGAETGAKVGFSVWELLTTTVTVGKWAAGLGAELVLVAPYVLISLETFKEEPRSRGCPALCPQCPQESREDGQGGQPCLNAPGHCGEHVCKNCHTWVGDEDPSQSNGDPGGRTGGDPSGDPGQPPPADDSNSTPQDSGQSTDPNSGGSCPAPQADGSDPPAAPADGSDNGTPVPAVPATDAGPDGS